MLNSILIPAICHGFWAGEKPLKHEDEFAGVKAIVSENGTLGCDGFTPKRGYNFFNAEFYEKEEFNLLLAARKVDADATIKLMKRELMTICKTVAGKYGTIEDLKAGRESHKKSLEIKKKRAPKNPEPAPITYGPSFTDQVRALAGTIAKAGKVMGAALEDAMNVDISDEEKDYDDGVVNIKFGSMQACGVRYGATACDGCNAKTCLCMSVA